MKIKRLHIVGRACVLFLLTVCVTVLTVHADDAGAEADVTLPPAYANLSEALPEDISSLLPEGLFSQDPGEVYAAAGELTSLRSIVSILLSAVGFRLDDCLRLLGLLIGLVLLSAIFRLIKDAVGGTGGQLFGFCVQLCMYAAMVELTVGMLDAVSVYFRQLSTFTAGTMPVMGALYALSGQISRAAVGEGLLVAHLSIIQYISASVTPPVCGICLSMALLSGVGGPGTPRLSALSAWIKKTYTSFLGLVMFLLSLALGAQTILASQADSLRMKGIKYAVGNMLPVVGGAVSGTLGTVAAGLSSLRALCGVCGIFLLGLLLLPTLIQLLLMRQVIHLSAVVAGLLNCDGEARLLEEISSLYGYLAAAASICSVLTVLSLGMLIK